MPSDVLLPLVRTAFLLAMGLQLSTSCQAAPISVDLKSFEFKVGNEPPDYFGYNKEWAKLFLFANGQAEATVKFPEDADYKIIITASCDSAEDERAKFKVSLDGKPVGEEKLLTADEAKKYTLKVNVKEGSHKLAIEFTNDAYEENKYDRNLYIHAVTVERVE